MQRIWSSRRIAFSFALTVSGTAVLASPACGSRGPLDIDVYYFAEDAGEAGPDVEVDAPIDVEVDAPQDVLTEEAAPAPTLVNCGLCLGQKCGGSIIACIGSMPCRKTFQCAATKCLAGGSPDLKCVFTCAGNDPSSLVPLLELFTCVTSMCGSDCTSLLGQLGGAGGGNRLGLGADLGERRKVVRQSFAQWPELCE